MRLITLQWGGETAWSSEHKHTVVFFRDQHGAVQAGRQAGAGAHRQQGALHPVHMPGDGWGGNGYAARPSVALHTRTQRGCSRSRGAAVTRVHRANISQISLSLGVTPFSHQPNPPPPCSDPHTHPGLGWMDGWMESEMGGGGFHFRSTHHSPFSAS